MKTRSFTLIELLIVIVIIGILAALAAPQYEKLMINAKGAEAMNCLRAISDSAWRYYLETGKFPPQKPGSQVPYSELDIQMPQSKYWGYAYAYQSYDPVTNPTGVIIIQASAFKRDNNDVPEGSKVYYFMFFTYDTPHPNCVPGGYAKLDNHWYMCYCYRKSGKPGTSDGTWVPGW